MTLTEALGHLEFIRWNTTCQCSDIDKKGRPTCNEGCHKPEIESRIEMLRDKILSIIDCRDELIDALGPPNRHTGEEAEDDYWSGPEPAPAEVLPSLDLLKCHYCGRSGQEWADMPCGIGGHEVRDILIWPSTAYMEEKEGE